MELDLFEFDGDEHVDEQSFSLEEEEEEEGEEDREASAAESKAFWEEQQQLLQDDLSRKSWVEARIRRATEEALRSMGSVICACSRECRCNCVLKCAVDRLRDAGYNSALCKSKWRRTPDIPSGEHSYIDVVVDSKDGKKGPIRIVIELNFRSEFEMARANNEYNRLVGRLPEVFVGKSERLRSVIKIMCCAAKKCTKENKMHLAPWRKHKYMQSKWLGTCERTSSSSLFVLPEADRTSRPARPRASMLTFDLHCPALKVV